jgi:hypothetical protein
MSTTPTPDDLDDSPTFTGGLRALADLLDMRPGLKRPDIDVCGSPADCDAYADAFSRAGLDYTDSTTDHSRQVVGSLPGLRLRIFAVHDASMVRHYAEQDVIKNHQDEVAVRVSERLDKAAARELNAEQASA